MRRGPLLGNDTASLARGGCAGEPLAVEPKTPMAPVRLELDDVAILRHLGESGKLEAEVEFHRFEKVGGCVVRPLQNVCCSRKMMRDRQR